MKVAVIHHSLNSGGGSERVCLEIINALMNAKQEVTFGSFEKTDWQLVESYYGDLNRPYKEVVGMKLPGDFTYIDIVNFSLLGHKVCKSSDIVIVSTTSPNVFGILNTHPYSSKKLIIYMNMFPYIYKSKLRRFYYTPYILMQKKIFNITNNVHVLVNSTYSAKIIREIFGVNANVLHPPVDVESFYRSNKQNLIVSVGRFSPFKRFEILIKSLSYVNDGKCIIMGSVTNDSYRESVTYLNKLKKMIVRLNLQDKIKLLINCPFETLKETLSKAKLIVNCTLSEPFGISIVEGMASGCAPIVYRSGGAYTDVIEYDKYGLSFKDANELGEKINLLLNNDDLYKKYSEKAIVRSKCFSRKNFEKNFLEIVGLSDEKMSI